MKGGRVDVGALSGVKDDLYDVRLTTAYCVVQGGLST